MHRVVLSLGRRRAEGRGHVSRGGFPIRESPAGFGREKNPAGEVALPWRQVRQTFEQGSRHFVDGEDVQHRIVHQCGNGMQRGDHRPDFRGYQPGARTGLAGRPGEPAQVLPLDVVQP